MMKNKFEELKKELIDDIFLIISFNAEDLATAASDDEVNYYLESIKGWQETITELEALELNYHGVNYLCNYYIERGFDLRKLKPFYMTEWTEQLQ